MKLTFFILCVCFIHVSAATYSQQQKVSLKCENEVLSKVLKELEKQTSLYFFFNDKALDVERKVSLSVEDKELGEVLGKLLGKDYRWEIMNNLIVVTFKPITDEKKEIRIVGKVTDEKKLPLAGVTVLVKGLTVGTATDMDGKYALTLPRMEGFSLLFSFLGMETQEVKYSGKDTINVVMREDVKSVEEVVVTGYANIKKSSFTGSATQVSREEILKVSSFNLISALAVFDPSLRLVKNNEMGSDPNTLPEFYVRGRSGIASVKELDEMGSSSSVAKFALTSNPNIPIFILDGFEVSVEKVYDFDINRIANITILKDAAATAMYGSRASNGVIVIESVAPAPGELRISYSGNLSITAPDLSSYNMMNAKEALETEVAAGLFDYDPGDASQTPIAQIRIKNQYYIEKLNKVSKGVDNYWLSQPLRTEVNANHSVYVEGGSESVRFGIDLRYNNQNGVMKDSYRNRLGAGFALDYRYKGLQVRNQTTFDITRTKDSPYGTFADYTRRHPYDEWVDKDGNYVQTLPSYGLTGTIEKNPLYEARLGNYSKAGYKDWTNNLTINWYINNYWQIKGQLALNYNISDTDKFTDPASSSYSVTASAFTKGERNLTETKSFGWNVNLFTSYNRSLGKHNVNLSVGINVKEDQREFEESAYKGFPNAKRHAISYAYEIVKKPTVTDNKTRLFGFFTTLNYSYDDIYLFDFSFRGDGSSEFGSDKKWGPFWSSGAGVNIHKYAFAEQWSFLDQLKVKATYGQTGKLNFPPYAARHSFETKLDQWYPTGIGATLIAMGNDKLTWEKTLSWDLGMEVGVFHGILFGRFNWYNRKTIDGITDVSLPASAGFSSYKSNAGEIQNRGMEFYLNVKPYTSKKLDIVIYGSLSHNENKILKLSKALEEYNDRVDEHFKKYANADANSPLTSILWTADDNRVYSKPVMKYEAGNSTTSIYGMKSKGINPADGQEIYLKRDGTISYEWSTYEQQKIGDTEPWGNGSLGINVRFMNFTFYTTFMFEFGGDKYNQTLVDNVENVNLWRNNADRRVLSQRWQKPGDVTSLKSLKDRYYITRPTSRFVQKDRTLTFNSLNVGYDFNRGLIQRIGLDMLRLQFSMNDIATVSSIKREMGLSYPFARTFTFTLNASF
ncbi:SusC/RagA family TonB-linked outer membrane protein [Butyricimonas sp. Marseille-P3923]|uniref:SusC/RagA family TonB-linked outer membrane protein n=1 Tax=Butyricimonas sp. Marseille-P3923 TaxID=1987504 RepID=UPI000C084392|nr:SusC/RagA family TonB-linked outer membrane protein [Butyricimonas sp. Marseille-P3923]